MNKIEFWILNIASVAVATLIFAHYRLAKNTQNLNNQIVQMQLYVQNSRQEEVLVDQISKRVAYDSEKLPSLRDLLAKHELKVTLTINGKQKTYP
jgi:hypothetical protein